MTKEEKENTALRQDWDVMKSTITDYDNLLTKAKELIKRLLKAIDDFQMIGVLYDIDTLKEAERFLKDSEVEK